MLCWEPCSGQTYAEPESLPGHCLLFPFDTEIYYFIYFCLGGATPNSTQGSLLIGLLGILQNAWDYSKSAACKASILAPGLSFQILRLIYFCPWINQAIQTTLKKLPSALLTPHNKSAAPHELPFEGFELVANLEISLFFPSLALSESIGLNKGVPTQAAHPLCLAPVPGHFCTSVL